MDADWDAKGEEAGRASEIEQDELNDVSTEGDSLHGEEDCYIELSSGEPCGTGQSHVHEFIGSTDLSGEGDARHNHRFAGITGEAIYVPGSHVHRLAARTDFFDHYHDLHVISGPATFLLDSSIKKCDRKHVHFAEGATARVDRHAHGFEFATLVEAPLFIENKEDRD